MRYCVKLIQISLFLHKVTKLTASHSPSFCSLEQLRCVLLIFLQNTSTFERNLGENTIQYHPFCILAIVNICIMCFFYVKNTLQLDTVNSKSHGERKMVRINEVKIRSKAFQEE